MSTTQRPNRLIYETSPYLRQHAHNPVAWQPWDEEALAQARREEKPILLSIGYSACHWCHVMAHESFEDAATAQVMNERFVNIKVDREERPDLDKIYQAAFQLLQRRAGGWPLTMFLTHDDQTPFVGGTYFPKTARYGMPAFVEVLRRISSHYRQYREDLREQNQALLEALRVESDFPPVSSSVFTSTPLTTARDQLLNSFDPAHGGFGGAPKFPHPTNLERLLRYWAASVRQGKPDEQAKTVALFTLHKMALSGVYDQLGGGFYRYSVDAEWQIPHFEKMLYDNGPLLALYAQAWRASEEPLFRRIAEETGEWIMRDMQAPEGGYYATLDADSEGEEGRFYLWTPDQVQAQLNPDEYAVIAARFGLNQPPNFEGYAWHLRIVEDGLKPLPGTAMEAAQLIARLTAARSKLLASREQRVWPGRDEKILTAWNGLMIRGMAISGRHLGRSDFVDSAERALDFIRTHLWRDGRLLAVYMAQQSRLNAYLDDYAFLIDAILELLQCRWRDGDLEFALALADVLLERFEDGESGGFFFTSSDHEQLIHRPKAAHDDALPAGNGVVAQVLLKLGHLTGRMVYIEAAEKTLRWTWPVIQQMPSACNAMLAALEEYLEPAQTIVLRGEGPALETWRKRCVQRYAPNRLTLAIPASVDLPSGLLAERKASTAPVMAYVCKGVQCLAPIVLAEELERELVAMEIAESPTR